VTVLGLVTDRTEIYSVLPVIKKPKSRIAFQHFEIQLIKVVEMLKCWCNSLILHTRCHRHFVTACCLTKEVHINVFLCFFFLILYICFPFCVLCVLYYLYVVSPLVYSRPLLIFVQAYRSLPPGGKLTAVNKYHIISSHNARIL